MADTERDLTLADDEHVHELVRELVPPEITGIHQVRSFSAMRAASEGRVQHLRLHLHDAGAHVERRWLVTAVSDDGKTVRGTAAPTIGAALHLCRWSDLD
jgi:hypothetical protein